MNIINYYFILTLITLVLYKKCSWFMSYDKFNNPY